MRKKHHKMVLLAKTKFSTIKVSISEALSEFVVMNDVLKDYNDMKEAIRNSDKR